MHLALMARQPVSKELWRQLQPLIPAFTPSVKGGARKLTLSDEAALNGILFVLQTGIPWEDLPQSLGYGSGMTCWRRLRDWNANGVWQRLHQAMLVRLREHDQIEPVTSHKIGLTPRCKVVARPSITANCHVPLKWKFWLASRQT